MKNGLFVDCWDKESTYAGARQFLTKKSGVGAVIRGFAPRPEDVPARVKQMLHTAEILQGLSVGSTKPPVKRIDLWVAGDKDRKDHDCGLLYPGLQEGIRARGLRNVFPHVIEYGDIFCGLLNRAVALNGERGCGHTLVLSSEANTNMTNDAMARMLNALYEGARVTGLGFDALKPLVLNGHIMNTCAIWSNVDLQQVGGFDLRCAQLRTDDPRRYSIPAWKDGGDGKSADVLPGDYTYGANGVEEVKPIIRMADTFRKDGRVIPFIAPIPGSGIWERPNPATHPEEWERFQNKMGTKWERMVYWANQLQTDITYVRQAVMPKYATHMN